MILNKRGNTAKLIYLITIGIIFFIAISIFLTAQNETPDGSAEVPSETNNQQTEQENIEEKVETELETNDDSKTTENQDDILSETQNETSQAPESETDSGNDSSNEEEQETLEPQPLKQELQINANLPEKITRGETFELEIEVTNAGNTEATNVVLEVILPEGFDSQEKIEFGKINPEETVTKNIIVSSSISTNLGSNEIKLILSQNA